MRIKISTILLKLVEVLIPILIIWCGVIMIILKFNLFVGEVFSEQSLIRRCKTYRHFNHLLIGDGLRKARKAPVSDLVELQELLDIRFVKNLITNCSYHPQVLTVIPYIMFLFICLVALIRTLRFKGISSIDSSHRGRFNRLEIS